MDYYSVLGISKDASIKDIKKAYKKLAIQYHPDKNINGSGSCGDKFHEIQKAYETLSDIDKRKEYDERDKVSDGSGSSNLIFNIIRHQQKSMNLPKVIMYPTTLFQLYRGDTVKHEVIVLRNCDICNGKGYIGNPLLCIVCRGGKIQNIFKQFGMGIDLNTLFYCHDCDGKGVEIQTENRCNKCNCSGTVNYVETVEFHIKPYSKHRDNVRIKNVGNDCGGGDSRGDIVFILVSSTIKENFIRIDDDIIYNCNIDLVQALFGCRISLTHPSGELKRIKIEPVITPRYEMILENEGFLNLKTGVKGNFIIKFDITFPQKLNKKYKKYIKSMIEQSN